MPTQKKGMKGINVYDVSSLVHQRLKQIALDNGTSVNSLMKEAITIILQKYSTNRLVDSYPTSAAVGMNASENVSSNLQTLQILSTRRLEELDRAGESEAHSFTE